MSPFQIIAVNPPGRKLGSSKGSRMGKGKTIVKSGFRRGKKFLGLSMPVVETGVAGAAGILGTNYITGFVLDKAGKDKPADHWSQQWWAKVAIKVAAAVGAGYIAGKVSPRLRTAVMAGGLSSAALSVVKNFAPASYDTRWGLAGDDSPEEVMASASNVQQALNGIVNRDELFDPSSQPLSGLMDSDTPYARMN